MRLVGGAQPHEGLVEVFLLSQWISLCIPEYRQDLNWTLSDATTVCKQLGYPAAVAAFSRATFAFQRGRKPTFFTHVADCIGNGMNSTQCSQSLRWPEHCFEHEAVEVICTGRLWLNN